MLRDLSTNRRKDRMVDRHAHCVASLANLPRQIRYGQIPLHEPRLGRDPEFILLASDHLLAVAISSCSRISEQLATVK